MASVIGGVVGGIFQKKAADKAADAQVKAAQIAADEQKRQFDAMMERTEPQYQLGLSALGKQAFYAGVGAPTGFANKLEEIGAPRYPGVDPMTGKIKYMGQTTVAPPPQYNPPASAIANNIRQQGVTPNWLQDYLRQAQGGV